MNDEWDEMIAPYGNHLSTGDELITDEDFNAQAAAIGKLVNVKSEKQAKRMDTQRVGKNSEARAKRVLVKMGFEDVRKMSTKFNGRWSVKARADFAGVWAADGRDMLCEVKHTKKPRLLYSALRKHQSKNLTDLARRNGIALLIWTYEKEKLVMKWPVDGFVSGTSIKIEQARDLSIWDGKTRWNGE